MKSAIAKFMAIGFIPISMVVHSDSAGMTPEKAKLYVETLRSLKEPVDSADVIDKLRPIFDDDMKIEEGVMREPNPEKMVGVRLQDKSTRISMQFPPYKETLRLPAYNVLSPPGEPNQIIYCASDAKWFENLSVGDLVKIYGGWSRALDGSQSEYRRSTFIFKSGSLKIVADGCYQTNPNDIRVQMLTVEWPTPYKIP